jgi:hypothetical protein
MGSILVRVFLHGLIAVAPVDPTAKAVLPVAKAPNHLVALAVDARRVQAANCVAPHTPQLVIGNPVQRECTDAHCAFGPDPITAAPICTCDLALQDVALVPDRAQAAHPLRKAPTAGLPKDRESAADFAYIANLSNLNLTLDPKYLGPAPAGLVARMRLPFDTILSCSLSAEGPEKSRQVHTFTFQRLNSQGASETVGGLHQALAETVEVDVPYDASAAGLLAIQLQGFGDKTSRFIHFKPVHDAQLCGSVDCADITFLNDRQQLKPDDTSCDDGIGHDFQLFYDLVAGPPAAPARPIPHSDPHETRAATDLAHTRCAARPMKAMASRPICAMAAFAP